MNSGQKCYEGKRENDTQTLYRLLLHYGLHDILEMTAQACLQRSEGEVGYWRECWSNAHRRIQNHCDNEKNL